MSILVGALILAFFGGLFLPLLVGLPWWVAIIVIPVSISARIIITERQTANKVMDIGNGVLIALFFYIKIFF